MISLKGGMIRVTEGGLGSSCRIKHPQSVTDSEQTGVGLWESEQAGVREP